MQINHNSVVNPQGCNLGLIGFNSTVNETPGCTVSCQQVIQTTFTSVPDVPVTSVSLDVGCITGRVSDAPGNPILNPNILNTAGPNSATCRNSGSVATADF